MNESQFVIRCCIAPVKQRDSIFFAPIRFIQTAWCVERFATLENFVFLPLTRRMRNDTRLSGDNNN